ncbi:serine/threonine-protein kinase [Streptomyces sp. NBC_00878]|uniref:serine/threonine-protein kinase n=1 Tax=Streptomyces sp. NBC_00878 TaxID=2975854 RepID=UPI00224D669B|nr:serine/threonine protein kinase [Streptomyces sp. NBC_00878]MCX4907173.1 protein kinase [Streptomyces sp. NBC_00878]
MGEVFAGRYELVDPIGRGGVGAVWRAWDHRRRRYVAAKVLQQSDAHSLLRFVREQALRIDHPHVLAPASWAADDDKVLFTMDLVGGGSLVHLIGDYGPLPPVFVCTLLDQLLAGLAAVHAEGVVHRDIKPANILLEATGTGRPRLRLSDFGISMRLGEPRLTETNYVVGTPGYFAPEQLIGAEPDFPADLFAVGLVALYLLEGAKPDAKALVDHFTAHGTPGAPKGVPEPLWQIVASLLQPDPQARFRTATGARKALAAARELLPEPGPDDELIEIFDQLGPLPAEFGPQGPLTTTAASGGAQPHDTAPQHHGPSTSTPSQQSGPASPSARTDTEGREARARSTAWPEAHAGAVSPQATTSPEARHGAVSPDAHTDTAWPRTRTGAVPPTPPADIAPQHPHAGAVPSPLTPGDVPPPPTTAPVPPQSPAVSDSGSFPQPPPPRTSTSHIQRHQPQPHPQAQPQPEQPPTPPTSPTIPNPAYSPSLPYEPTHTPSPQAPHVSAPTPVSPPQPREFASTASYTAQDVRVPPQPQPVARHRARRAPRRPGPPANVAVPVLLLALACFAVGFWALTQI